MRVRYKIQFLQKGSCNRKYVSGIVNSNLFKDSFDVKPIFDSVGFETEYEMRQQYRFDVLIYKVSCMLFMHIQ